jgi:hypothetical protein
MRKRSMGNCTRFLLDLWHIFLIAFVALHTWEVPFEVTWETSFLSFGLTIAFGIGLWVIADLYGAIYHYYNI